MTQARTNIACSMLLAAMLALTAGATAQPPATPTPGPPWPESYLRRTGEVVVPVLMVKFKNSGEPFTGAELTEALFKDTGQSNTLTDYYRENSYGQFKLGGEAHGWYGLSHDHAHYHGGLGCHGTCPAGLEKIRELIQEAVQKARAGGVDFSRYDSDGPDGRPDSGDDDGFVDLLLLVFSDRGGQCNTGSKEGIIPHEQKIWNLYPSGSEQVLDSGSTGHGGRTIFINEFVIVPGQSCKKSMNTIGDYAHEIGHALGLPDLVNQGYTSGGIGYWSLMAEGGAGGDGASPESPTHLSAWAKEKLGWLRPRMITTDGNYSLKPAEEHAEAIRVPFLDGTSHQEYLLEVRARKGFDTNLPGPGLLVWRINTAAVEEWERARQENRNLASVNDEDTRKGVVLIEADGRRDLAAQYWDGSCSCLVRPGCRGSCKQRCSEGGDAGDPFPGSADVKVFDFDSKPRSFGGVALCKIKQVGDEVHFRLATNGDCS